MKMCKHSNIIACAMISFATITYSEINLEDQVGRISRLRGDDYVAERDRMIQELEPEHMHKLRTMRDDTQKDWNLRAQAGILVERHERGADFVELVETDWLEDPEFDQDWIHDKLGPLDPKLVIRRYREAGFWYHYLEHFLNRITTAGIRSRVIRGEADFHPGVAYMVLRYCVDNDEMKYYGPDEFRRYLLQWAVGQVESIENVIVDDYRRGRIWEILVSNNTRESRQAQLEMLKLDTRLCVAGKWKHLISLIRNAEYKDEADMYQDYVDEYLREELTLRGPTLLEDAEEYIEKLRQKDQPGTLREVLNPPPPPSNERPQREPVEDPFAPFRR